MALTRGNERMMEGVQPVGRGGTGGTSPSQARDSLGIGSIASEDVLYGDTAFDLDALPDGEMMTVNITVEGAQPGDFVAGIGFDHDTEGLIFSGMVADVGMVAVTILNMTGDPVSLDVGDLAVRVVKRAPL